MGLIFIEGFDAYALTNGDPLSGHTRKWPTSNFPSFVTVHDGRISGKAALFASNTYLNSPVFAEPTLTIGFAVRFNASPAGVASGGFVGFVEGSNLGINVRLTEFGELAVYLGSTQLAVTNDLAIPLNTWLFVELSVTVHNSAGSYALRVGGHTVLSASGIDTQPGSNAWIDVVRVGTLVSSTMRPVIDDLYVRDDATFLGSCKVQTLFPTADDTVSCAPSTGSSNFAMVDENPANGDTDYVTGDDGDSDKYEFSNLVNLSEVYGVMVNTTCRETDASPFKIKQLCNSGGSAAETIGSTSYVHRGAIFETNPDTSSAWTPAEVDAAKFGFEIEI